MGPAAAGMALMCARHQLSVEQCTPPAWMAYALPVSFAVMLVELAVFIVLWRRGKL